jgi:hypothetical protein
MAAPRPAAPAPVAADPLTKRAARLEREGFVFAAAAERKQLVAADHQARRREVEAEVQKTERLFRTLCRNFGEDYATRYIEGG